MFIFFNLHVKQITFVMEEVYIVSAARTPIGSFSGSLSSLSATQLGAKAVMGAMEKIGLEAKLIQEVYFGNVLSAGLGQAPATQVTRFAGLGEIPATTVNKVCASGLKAVMLGAQAIALGQQEIVLAGGAESMSNVPYYLDKARQGYRLGNANLIDGLVNDGLWDVYNDYHMGSAAELCARTCGISRLDQDQYAIHSYQRAHEADKDGKFKAEIIPVEIQDRKGNIHRIDQDEEMYKVDFEKIPHLKAVFEKDGSVTAANASTLNDGAAALILMNKKQVQALGLQPLARIRGYADAQQAPEWFTTAPAAAIPKALQVAGIALKEVDFFEINEAFSVVALANSQKLGLSEDRVNINGGAVALGHPLGASGARILVTLLSVLEQKNARIGVAGICNGGGGASALVVERIS